MRVVDIVTTASGNILRSKLRTFLTITAILIGAFTLTLTNGLGTGISSYINRQVDSLGAKDVMIIQAGDSSAEGPGLGDAPKSYDPSKKVAATSFGTATTVLTNADVDKIKKIDGIKSVEPNLIIAPDYISGPNDKKFQTSAQPYITDTHIDLEAGEQLDNAAANRDMLLPNTYIEPLGFKDASDAVGKLVTIGVSDSTGTQHVVTATVRGVQRNTLVNTGGLSANTALTQAIYDQQTLGLPTSATNSYQYLIARFDGSAAATQTAELKQRLKDAGYAGQTVQDQLGSFQAVIDGIIAVLNAFAIIALLAAGFGIINTLLMSVQERTKEIGLMKAMGMGGGRIFALFSFEAIALGFWGSALGVALAVAAGTIANKVATTTFLKDLEGLQLLTFTAPTVIGVVLLVMAIGFLAGTLPAYRAARQNPIDSLRYE
jgi:putative ABC transport system permease protein